MGAHALRDRLGESVNLTIREGDVVVYLEKATPNRMMHVQQVVGSRAPLHVTAVGKLMLGEAGADAVEGAVPDVVDPCRQERGQLLAVTPGRTHELRRRSGRGSA